MRRVCRWVVILVPATAFCQTQPATTLPAPEMQLVHAIERGNKLNQGLLQSFDARYEMEVTMSDSPTKILKSGRYAYSMGRTYVREIIPGSPTIEYVQDGKTLYHVLGTPTRMVATGSKDRSGLKPPTQTLWELIDDGISTHLEQVDPSQGHVTAVRREELAGEQVLVVSLDGMVEVRPGQPRPMHRDIFYSPAKNYLAVESRNRTSIADALGKTFEFSQTRKIESLKTYEVGGKTLFLPTAVTNFEQLGDKESFRSFYRLDIASVQLNPPLPDSLFKVKVNRTDYVWNKDLEMEVVGPQVNLLDLAGDPSNPTTKPGKVVNGDAVSGSIGLVYVMAGRFTMGSPPTEEGYSADMLRRLEKRGAKAKRPEEEGPPRSEEVTPGFYVGKCEVTVGQFRSFRPEYHRGDYFTDDGRKWNLDGDKQPAMVTWDDAVAYCEWASKKTGLKVRLPTEKEWEYACRAGSTTRFSWGADVERMGSYANVADRTYHQSFPKQDYIDVDDGYLVTAEVGTLLPNAWGLYDMLGNVPEWCSDEYGQGEGKQERVIRGGGWQDSLSFARSAARRGHAPNDQYGFVGFRVVVDAPGDGIKLKSLSVGEVVASAKSMAKNPEPGRSWRMGHVILLILIALAAAGGFLYLRRKTKRPKPEAADGNH